MAYIGASPSNGVRRKHTYTATASQTTFSGAGAEGAVLSYRDSNYVDVYVNGVKLGDADYTATSGTSIVLGVGAAVNDIVEIMAYDVFSVADTVSKADGGQFDGNVTMAGTLGVTGVLTGTSLDISGDIDVDGTTNLDVVDIDSTLNVQGETTLQTHLNMGDNDIIKLGDSADLQIYHDGSSSIIYDAGTGNLQLASGGTGVDIQKAGGEKMATFAIDGAVNLYYDNAVKLATTSSGIQVTGNIANTSGDLTIDVAGDIILDADGADVSFRDGGTGHLSISNSSNDAVITSLQNDKDMIFKGVDGGSVVTALTLDMSDAGTAVFNKNITVTDGSIASGVTHTFNLFGATGTGGNANYATYSFVGDPNTGMFSGTADTLKFATGGSERMRINANGQLLLGTTTSRGKLTIGVDSSSADGLYLDNANGSATMDLALLGSGYNAHGANAGEIWFYSPDNINIGGATGNTNSIKFLGGGAERVRITSAGNVGIGSSSPAVTSSTYKNLQVALGGIVSGRTDDTPLYLSSNVSYNSGWKYIANTTASQIALGTNIQFFNAPSGTAGAGATLTEHMRIDSSGRLKVNTTAHDSGRVNITENLALRVGLCVRSNYSANTGNFILFTSDNGTNAGAIRHDNASTVSYLTSSDYRLKKNITYDFDATSRLKQLKPARFSWNDDDTNTLVDGFIAHEVQSVIPQAVGGEKDAINEDGSINPQGIDQSKLVPLLVKTIQELEARIVALENA